MRALSIRQPYAELILRGEKTIEYRSRPVGPKLIGTRFYIYASRKWAEVDPDKLTKWQGDGVNGTRSNGHPVTRSHCHLPTPLSLPTGVLVGTAVITHCTPNGTPGMYEWHLADVQRLPPEKMRRPTRQPQPVWFRPF